MVQLLFQSLWQYLFKKKQQTPSRCVLLGTTYPCSLLKMKTGMKIGLIPLAKT